jgi:hypothetical protein
LDRLKPSFADRDPYVFGPPGSGSPDPLVRGMDPVPLSSLKKAKTEEIKKDVLNPFW